MAWRFNTDINKRIQGILVEAQKVDAEIKIINDYQKEFARIHAKFNNLYGKKFGINQRKVKRRLERAELERMMHLIRAEDSQPQKTGFLGFGALKKEDYYVFTDKLNLVSSNLEFLVDDWNACIDSMLHDFGKVLDDYEQHYLDVNQKNKEVGSLTVFEPGNEQAESLCLGKMMMKVPREERLIQYLESKSYSHYDGEYMHLLTELDLADMTPCYVQYSNEEQLNDVYAWIRNLYKKMLVEMKPYHFELLYLDGIHNASGLKEYLNLQSIQDDYVEDIDSRLMQDTFKIVRVKRDSDSIRKELQNLEKYMGIVTDMLQGVGNFAEYNKFHTEKIPCRFVILEGMDSHVDATLLRKLLTNGPKCGIWVVYLQDEKMLNDRDRQQTEDMFSGFQQIKFKENGIWLEGKEIMSDCDSVEYGLMLEENSQFAFVEDVLAKLGIKKVLDNNFDTCFPMDYKWGQYTSTEKSPDGNLKGKITIPFALDKRGKIVSIELGSADFAHGLVSGGTGSGKSTMLHMLIASVVMNYHPKDVEIWLADYKQTEMSVYIKNRPPHVKFIGIERNEEFTFSLIDMIFEEYERRSQLFVDNGVRNIDAYRNKFGMHSLPRILVIIDEFHLMAQQVYENPTYSERLENILAEARASGIVCLFSDQAISVGLKGLTDKGKKQMRQRLALANDKEEISVTLDTKITDAEAVLQMGEVLQKKIVAKTGADDMQGREAVLEMNKVIYLSDAWREKVAEKANALYGESENPIIIDGKKQAIVDWNVAEQYEKMHQDGRETFFLHLGKPSNFEACYALPLIRDYGQNVICIHNNQALQKLIFINALKSFLRVSDSKIYIMADENDYLYRNVRLELEELKKKYSNIIIASDMESVCRRILELSDEMIARRKKNSREADLVLWLGMDSILREFQYYGALPKDYKASTTSSQIDKAQDALQQKMASLFGDMLFEEPKIDNSKAEESDCLYNLTEQVVELIKEGAKRGIFQFLFLSNLLALKAQRTLKLEQFAYKMSGYLDRDNSLDFYGSFKFMNGMSEKKDNISLVCYDGRKARFFVPYIE